MPHPEHILNLTSDPEGVVYLHADQKGLEFLIQRLQKLKDHLDRGECEHDHFMSDSWGGYELSEENGLTEKNHSLVHHLKVMAWTDDWATKHGLRTKETEPGGAANAATRRG